MNNYQNAKQTSLGLKTDDLIPAAHYYDNIVVGQKAQTGVELFSKTFDTPPELIIRKSVLSLFDEYERDYSLAHTNLQKAAELSKGNDLKRLNVFLKKNPVVFWLNCIFLEDEDIDGFSVELETVSGDVSDMLARAVREGLASLVNFRGLLDALLRKLEARNDAKG